MANKWKVEEVLQDTDRIKTSNLLAKLIYLLGLNCIWIFYFQNLTIIHVLKVKPNIWVLVYFIYTFAQVKINVEISFFEIYNEKIHDLLASSKEKGGKKPTVSYFG